MGDYRPNITCESLEVIGELMPVQIPQDSLEIHSEMLKLIGNYTQHYNAKTRSNAFNTMVINKHLVIYWMLNYIQVPFFIVYPFSTAIHFIRK